MGGKQRLEMDEDSSTEWKTWQAHSFGKRNVFRLHLTHHWCRLLLPWPLVLHPLPLSAKNKVCSCLISQQERWDQAAPTPIQSLVNVKCTLYAVAAQAPTVRFAAPVQRNQLRHQVIPPELSCPTLHTAFCCSPCVLKKCECYHTDKWLQMWPVFQAKKLGSKPQCQPVLSNLNSNFQIKCFSILDACPWMSTCKRGHVQYQTWFECFSIAQGVGQYKPSFCICVVHLENKGRTKVVKEGTFQITV